MIWKFLYCCMNSRYSRNKDEKCLSEAAMTRDREILHCGRYKEDIWADFLR